MSRSGLRRESIHHRDTETRRLRAWRAKRAILCFSVSVVNLDQAAL
jgi:hypothetical protein